MTVNEEPDKDRFEITSHVFSMDPDDVLSYLLIHIYQNVNKHPGLRNVWMNVMREFMLDKLKSAGVNIADLEQSIKGFASGTEPSIN